MAQCFTLGPGPLLAVHRPPRFPQYIIFVRRFCTGAPAPRGRSTHTQTRRLPARAGVPPVLAAAWFGSAERATATSIGVLANQVGKEIFSSQIFHVHAV